MVKSIIVVLMSLLLSVISTQANVIVYEADFEDGTTLGTTHLGTSASFSGVTTIADTQGFSGFGFGSNFIWNRATGNPAPGTVLTLTNLPEHSVIIVQYDFCQIESWDGTTGPDYFNTRVDNITQFSGVFHRSHSPGTTSWVDTWNTQTSIQYDDPRILFLSQQLIKTHQDDAIYGHNYYREAAYRLGEDEIIPHASDSVTIRWFASGGGWQGGNDESWAIDNIKVTLIPEPCTLVLLGLGSLALRKRNA